MRRARPLRFFPMRRPLNWFVIALSLAFLVAGRSMTPRNETINPRFVGDERAAMRAVSTFEPQTLQFESAARWAVPAAQRHERELDFGYVRLDSQLLQN